MSIASEVERLESAKSDLKTALESKGVAVPEEAKLDEFPVLVQQLGNGDMQRSVYDPQNKAKDIFKSIDAAAGAKVQKIWENPSPTVEYAAQTISVPGLADYDMIIIFTNANGNLPYAYNPPTMAPKMGNNEISVTSYQGTFMRGFTVNFAAQMITIGDAYTAGIDNRYLVPALIFGIKF